MCHVMRRSIGRSLRICRASGVFDVSRAYPERTVSRGIITGKIREKKSINNKNNKNDFFFNSKLEFPNLLLQTRGRYNVTTDFGNFAM